MTCRDSSQPCGWMTRATMSNLSPSIPGLGDMHEYVTDRAECMKQPEGAEIFATSLIHPQRALPSPHDLGQAVYRLIPSSILARNAHPVEPGRTARALLRARLLRSRGHRAHASLADDATWQLPHCRHARAAQATCKPSAYLEVKAPEIQALARSRRWAMKKIRCMAARRIEDILSALYITKKDLNIGFASAEETAKSCEGDCTEHAVLCAALGRAAGLPTRCVVGFGYIPPGEEEPTIYQRRRYSSTGTFGFPHVGRSLDRPRRMDGDGRRARRLRCRPYRDYQIGAGRGQPDRRS